MNLRYLGNLANWLKYSFLNAHELMFYVLLLTYNEVLQYVSGIIVKIAVQIISVFLRCHVPF